MTEINKSILEKIAYKARDLIFQSAISKIKVDLDSNGVWTNVYLPVNVVNWIRTGIIADARTNNS